MATPADRVQFVRPYKKQKKRERIGVVEYRVECVCVCVQENEGPKRCSPMKNRSTVSADTEANTDNCGSNYPHNCSLFAFTYSLSLSLSLLLLLPSVYNSPGIQLSVLDSHLQPSVKQRCIKF